MAVKDYTSQLINTLAMFQPDIKPIDFSGVVDSYQNAYDKAHNKFLTDALSKALQGGDENQINSAFAALDPVSAVANRLSQQQMQQRRDWQLEDAERDHRWELDKLNMQHYLAKELADYKSSLGGSESPFNSKNEFINLMGIKNNQQVWDSLSDEDKMLVNARLNYMSNNPENVYEKAYQQSSGKERGKQLANSISDKEGFRKALTEMKSLEDALFNPQTGKVFKAKINTITDRAIPTQLLDPEAQEARQYIQNSLGRLRLDQMQFLKGAISDKEQEFLADMVANNVRKYSPMQVRGAFNSIVDKIIRELGDDANNQSIPSDDAAWGGI